MGAEVDASKRRFGRAVMMVVAFVDTAYACCSPQERRRSFYSLLSQSITSVHHSATHLLHSAIMKVGRAHRVPSSHSQALCCILLQVLGTSAAQAGSCVDDRSLRFDFTYPTQVLPAQLAELELWVL